MQSKYILDVLLSTKWVDYVEEPMKYQALRPHFFSMVGGWRVLGVGGGGVGHGVGGGGVGGVGVVVLWVPMTPPSWGVSDVPYYVLTIW